MKNMNTSEKVNSPGTFQRFFWWASGVTPSVIIQCPTDQRFYAAIGAVMLLIATLAGFSAAFSVKQAFGSLLIAVPCGVFWGGLIFTVERIVQISIRKDEERKRQSLLLGILRFSQIAVVSFLITDPLLHTFFEKEIDFQLRTEAQQVETDSKANAEARVSDEINQLQTANENLKAEIKNKETERDKKFNEWMAEGEGTGGTMIRGKGQFYQEKEAAYRKADQEFQDTKARNEKVIEQNTARINELKQHVADDVASVKDSKEKAKGWLARNSALFKIMKHDFGAAFFAILLILAFVLIESIPMFAKLFSERGAYDACLSRVEKEQIASENEKLQENERRIKYLAQSRLENEAKVTDLKKKTMDEVIRAIQTNQRDKLNEEQVVLADAIWSKVKYEILNEFTNERRETSDQSYSKNRAAKPSPLLVRVLEPEGMMFKVNFNLPEKLVKGSDLLYSLQGIDEDLLSRNENSTPLTAYRVVNDGGIEIEPSKPLFDQLNGSRAVNLILGAQSVSDAEN